MRPFRECPKFALKWTNSYFGGKEIRSKGKGGDGQAGGRAKWTKESLDGFGRTVKVETGCGLDRHRSFRRSRRT